MSRALADACGSLVDLILPRRCVQCGRAGGWLCAGCRSELRPLGDSACARCGAPARRPVAVCRECRGRELAFDAAAAAYVYDGPARRMVTTCKFRALRSLTAEMAALAAGRFEAVLAGRAAADAADAVTWVPVSRQRKLDRGFDQAALFGRRLASAGALPAVPLLRRVRAGARQSGLGAADRAANVKGAFALDERAWEKVGKVKNVVIVDDVYTTGETLNECSLVLKDAGCRAYVFTFARAARCSVSG